MHGNMTSTHLAIHFKSILVIPIPNYQLKISDISTILLHEHFEYLLPNFLIEILIAISNSHSN